MSDEYENDAEVALTHLAADLVGELTARQLALELAAARQELAEAGQISGTGSFIPQAGPQARTRHPAYSDTLMNPDNRRHLLSGQPRPHYYGGPVLTEGAEMPQDSPGQQQGASPAPVLPEAEMNRRGVYEAARGQGGGVDVQLQQPQLPEASPQRPARRARKRRGRMPQYGRR